MSSDARETWSVNDRFQGKTGTSAEGSTGVVVGHYYDVGCRVRLDGNDIDTVLMSEVMERPADGSGDLGDLGGLLDTGAAEGPNARIVVTYAGEAVSFDLEGTELSEIGQADGSTHRYLDEATRTYLGEQVEGALMHLAHDGPLTPDLSAVAQVPLLDAGADVDPVTDALTLLVHAPVMNGATEHDLETERDGDGWTQPHSEHYSCICGTWDGPSWVQVDPEHTGQPDPVQVALAWREHYLTYRG